MGLQYLDTPRVYDLKPVSHSYKVFVSDELCDMTQDTVLPAGNILLSSNHMQLGEKIEF